MSLQHFLYDLVTHEANVEITLSLHHRLSRVKIIVRLFPRAFMYFALPGPTTCARRVTRCSLWNAVLAMAPGGDACHGVRDRSAFRGIRCPSTPFVAGTLEGDDAWGAGDLPYWTMVGKRLGRGATLGRDGPSWGTGMLSQCCGGGQCRALPAMGTAGRPGRHAALGHHRQAGHPGTFPWSRTSPCRAVGPMDGSLTART